ncbi:polymer-forming cytoskeletal protein [Deltaproteobacteria bacterium TL4]
MSAKKYASLPVIKGPSHLGEDLKIEGQVQCSGTLYINGYIDGSIVGDSEILIGQSGSVHGTLEGKTVIVGGSVEGNLIINHQLEVLQAGKIRGGILIPPGSIVIHEGAVLEGECHTLPTNKIKK